MSRIRSNLQKIGLFLVLILILYISQHLVNFLSYDDRGPSRYFVSIFLKIGIEHDIARFIIWDVFQILITFISITLFIRKPLKEIGFNLKNHRKSIKIILMFIFIFTLITALCWILIYQFLGLDALIGGIQKHTMGYMIRDVLAYGLLPGLSEEPLFRVFVIQFLLLNVFKGKELSQRSTRFQMIILSAIIFSYGHIYIVSFSPFTVNYNVLQLIAAFGLGIFYAITYIRTKSILAVVICHNYSDLLVRLGSYILFYLVN